MFGHVSHIKRASFPWWYNSYWLCIQLSGMYSALKCRHLCCVQNCIVSPNWFKSSIHTMMLHLYCWLLTGMKGFLEWLDDHMLIPLSRICCYFYPKRRENLITKAGWVLPWRMSDIMDNKVDSIWFLLLELRKSGSVVTPLSSCFLCC